MNENINKAKWIWVMGDFELYHSILLHSRREEFGIDLTKDSIMDLGYLVFDFPVRFIFYLKKDIKLNDITLQKEDALRRAEEIQKFEKDF